MNHPIVDFDFRHVHCLPGMAIEFHGWDGWGYQHFDPRDLSSAPYFADQLNRPSCDARGNHSLQSQFINHQSSIISSFINSHPQFHSNHLNHPISSYLIQSSDPISSIILIPLALDESPVAPRGHRPRVIPWTCREAKLADCSDEMLRFASQKAKERCDRADPMGGGRSHGFESLGFPIGFSHRFTHRFFQGLPGFQVFQGFFQGIPGLWRLPGGQQRNAWWSLVWKENPLAICLDHFLSYTHTDISYLYIEVTFK